MDLYLQLFLYMIIIAPLSLFWHELGHVMGAKLAGASQVVLTIGVGRPIFERVYNNVTIIIRKLFIFNSFTETKRPDLLSNYDKIVITFMGPVSSLVLSLLAYFLYVLILPHLLLVVLCLFNLWIGVINLIPFKINERQSDGYTILQMFKNKYD